MKTGHLLHNGPLVMQKRLETYQPTLIKKNLPLRAAVAIIFLVQPDAELRLVFIKRSVNHNDPWSGHMAFPGGRLEPKDRAIIAAAYRETDEEIGLDLASNGQIVGRLDDVQAMARGKEFPMIISPFVFFVTTEPAFLKSDEIVEIHCIPLLFFGETHNMSTLTYTVNGSSIQLPCYRYNDRIIWGLTYRMLQNLFQVIGVNWSTGRR